MSVLEIKHDLMKLLVETDDAELLHQVRRYFRELKNTTEVAPPEKSIETINELIEAAEQDEGTSYETFKASYKL